MRFGFGVMAAALLSSVRGFFSGAASLHIVDEVSLIVNVAAASAFVIAVEDIRQMVRVKYRADCARLPRVA